jgi:fatty-acyl-CoA synthase/feruloyl-CoA synthase
MRDGDRYLHLSPFYHSGGVVFRTATTLLGGAHVIGGAFEPAATLALLEAEHITAFLGVPTMYQQLLAHPDIGRRDLSRLRIAVFGAAAMPAATIEELLTRLPGVDLFQMCGQTEAGPTGLYSTTEQLRERPDSTGHLSQPFLEHRVVRADGSPAEAGEVGELLFRGEAVMKGYWGRPDSTAEAMEDGWLHTGDLFRSDSDGALVLVDRLKDMIISGGQNVYSAEVEQAIRAHPAVLDCAVVGRPHDLYGATVVAAVQLRDGASLSLDELRGFCEPRLAHYKIPRDLNVLETLPRNGAGKLQKHCIPSD